MALDTFTQGPNPKWYFVNNNGKPLAGGKFNTFSSLNPSLRKSVYSTPSLDFPLPNPATIDANGTLGPFWFAFDSVVPDDGYVIIVTDANGQVIWTADDYFAGGGGGGGGGTTTVIDVVNLINNNVFWRHSDTIPNQVPTFSVIAPSNHANLVPNTNLSGKSVIDSASPDIIFVKNNVSGTDTITFPNFALGEELNDDGIIDAAPVDYFRYTCSVAGTETTKFLQFPITAKAQNLQNQTISGSFWARHTAGTGTTITLSWFQFFGDGAGASIPVKTVINSFPLSNAWEKYNYTATVPSVSGKSLGAPSAQGPNDGLFIRVGFPTSATTTIDFTKLTFYLGDDLPDLDFVNYDNIDSVIAIPRTGDVRTSINSFVPFGWVPCNDGVISDGGVVTLPTGIPQARNNIDTYPLYYMIWNLTSGYPAFAPIFTSAGAVSVRGVDAITDFAAGKQLQLTKMLGRVIAGANPNLFADRTFSASAATDLLTVASATQYPTGTPVILTTTGTLPAPLDTLNVPSVYYSIFVGATTIRLARSLELAQAGTFIDITSAGAGTHSIHSADGTYFGSAIHTVSLQELPNSLGQVRGMNGASTTPPPPYGTALGSSNTTGLGPIPVFNPTLDPVVPGALQQALNFTQPTAFLNVMLKL